MSYIGEIWSRGFLLCVLIMGSCTGVLGQDFEYVAEKFTKDHGLPDDYIKDLDIDSNGNIWVLTRKGLLKFDGLTFESVSIKCEVGFKEFEIDKNDNLWLRLVVNENNNFVRERIIIYKPDLNQTVKLTDYCEIRDFDSAETTRLWKDCENNILTAYWNSTVFMYDGVEFKKVTATSNDLYTSTINRSPYIISQFPLKRDKIIYTDTRTNVKKVIEEDDINFFIWHNDKIQFKSHFNLDRKNAIENGSAPKINLISVSNDTLFTDTRNELIYEFIDDDFYFISDDILKVYNLESKQIINLSELLFPMLSNLDLLNLRIVEEKIWIGTNEGIVKIEQKKNIFQALLNDDNLSIREILSISKDSLLVCSKNGVFLVDIKKNIVLQKYGDESQFYGITKIDSDKYLLGNFGRKSRVLNLKTGKITRFSYNIVEVSKKKRRDVFLNSYLDKNDNLWITSKKGVGLFDIEKGVFKHMFQDEIGTVYSTDILPGFKENLIFLLSNNGMFLIDVDLYEITKIDDFENLVISHICEDKDEDLTFWVSTRYGGLIKWKYGHGILETVTEKDGLGNNNVHSVFEDNHGRLWLSTDYGISIYNKSTREISVITEENGIHENEMNRHSYCFVNDSLIVYGGINGLIKFNPYDVRLEDNSKEINVKFLKYQELSNNKNKVIQIDKDVKELILKRNQNNPKLIFDIPQNSFSNTLRYIISSENSEWSYTQGNSIDLSNLKEGNSILFVSKKIGINEWSSPKNIIIFKSPPFYRAYWFYAVLISVFSLIVFLYVNSNRLRALKINKVISREVEIKAKELYFKNKSLTESKRLNDQLFAIIGHDLRSPLISLNNISKSINYLTEKGQYKDVKKLTKTVESNSKKSLAIIDRLIEWTERQKDSMLEFHEVVISECVGKSIYEHEEFALQRGIRIKSIDENALKCISNESSLLIILGNILSNAIKFSHDNGEILVRYYCSETELVIEIEDHGIGMEGEQLEKINKFEPVDSMKSVDGQTGLGMGILMSSEIVKKIKGTLHFKSELNKGTTAFLKLPYSPFD